MEKESSICLKRLFKKLMYIINCFGSGIRYWLCRIPKNEFVMMDEYRIKNQCNWVDIFFNLEILDKFGYNDWESIHLLQEGKGWLLKKGNWIVVVKVLMFQVFLPGNGTTLCFCILSKRSLATSISRPDCAASCLDAASSDCRPRL